MITHQLREQDLDTLRALHKQHYGDEFPFPNFANNFISTFKICQNDGRIITAGGIKLFPEIILITDKDASSSSRAFALTSAMQISTLCANNLNHELLYASAQDQKWQGQLVSIGFRPSKNHNFVIG